MRRGSLTLVGLCVAVLVLTGAISAQAAPDDDDDLDAALADLDITEKMVDNSTYDLEWATTNSIYDLEWATANSTFDIKSDGSEFPLEVTETTGDETVVTLASDLLFEFGQSDLTEPARAALVDMVVDIPQGAAVSVDGYTDSISGDDVNVPLSQARAQTVADALATPRSDLVLTVVGHGSGDPVADNTYDDGSDNPVGRALNRRVTITYTVAS